MYESVKVLEINTSILLNLVFTNNTILSCFFFFSLITNLNFSTAAVIAQIFQPTVELVILIGIPIKKAKAEIETHPTVAETKIRKWLV